MDLAFTVKVRSGPLIRHRLQNELTQAEAARAADVTLYAWGRIERLDFTSISMGVVIRLAEHLHIPPEDIVPEELRDLRLCLDRTVFAQRDARQLLVDGAGERLTLPSPASEVMKAEALAALGQGLNDVLKTLTYREREILKLRYGLGTEGGDTLTLREVGEIFRVTRDRVRQIEAKALRKLQHPVRTRKLEPFISGGE